MRMMRLWQMLRDFYAVFFFLCSRQHFEQFVKHVLTFGLYYSVYPSPSETFRGSNFWCV
jgi:hypothetical protein